MQKKFKRQDLAQLITRIVFIQIIFIGSLSTTVQAVPTYAQNTLQQSISLRADHLKLRKILVLLEKQSNVKFIYSSRIIPADYKVSLSSTNQILSEVLETVLKPLRLTYKVNGNQVILLKESNASFGLLDQNQDVAANLAEEVITGKVTAENGDPIPGATVIVKGTSNGTTTNPDGTFTLNLPDRNVTLVFSFIGYTSKEVAIAGQSAINVTLTPDVKALNEVVVVGYGAQKRQDITGAISSVSAKEITELPITQASQALQGRAAGVDVTTAGNKPGAGATVRIRGNRSFQAGNDPLYVVDGMPLSGGLSDINPQDIESMEVLKDASATAIYGSRGANGVIIVTTRRGKAGKTTVNYSGYTGISSALGQADLMNGAEYAEYKRESRRAAGNYDDANPVASDEELFEPVELESIALGRTTDYQKLILKNGFTQNHQVSVLGGSENTRFNLSLNYFEDEGIVPLQDYTRYTSRINLDHTIGKRFKVGTSTLGTYSIRNGGDLNPFPEALLQNPLSVPYDAEGNLIFRPTLDGLRTNPLHEIQPNAYINKQKGIRLFSSLYGEATLAEGLKFRLNFGPDLLLTRKGDFQGSLTQARREGASTAQENDYFQFNYTLENILTYQRTFAEKHAVDFTGLYSVQNQQEEGNSVGVEGIPVDDIQFYNLGAARSITGTSSFFRKQSILSYMGRVNYIYNDRFLLTLTGRADGSSRFGRNNKWGFFPSVAVGWTISNEQFLQESNVLDLLKLRLSYGKIGNTGISPYQTQAVLGNTAYAFGDTPAFGFAPDRLRNDDLRWETTTSFNAGVDFGLLKGRLFGSAEVYQQNTRDLLLQRQLPYSGGFSSILQNIGATRNTGFEMTLSSVNIKAAESTGFTWATDLNFFTNKEEILELYNGKQDDPGSNWFIGQPIQVYYDYEKIGIWQTAETEEAKKYQQKPGEIKVKDQNGDGQINADDRVVLGSTVPQFSGGLTNRFAYKGFDLSVFLFARLGSTISSTFHTNYNPLFGRYNNLRVDYWTPDNPTNAYPRPNMNQERPIYNTSMAYFDGSFLKIRNINLGYNFPAAIAQKIKTESLRVYVSAQQPLIIAPYVQKEKGVDPEDVTNSTPAFRTFLFGLNVKF